MSDKIKIYRTNKLINGETVSYAVVAFFSVFLLFALKQFLKLTFGISAPVALSISFVVSELVSFLLEKRFVFAKSILSTPKKQILFFIFSAGVDFGFYKLSEFIFGDLLRMDMGFIWLATITLVVFFNYFYARLLIFDCNYDAESVSKSKIYKLFYENRYIALSLLLTSVSLLTVFALYQVFPIGDYTVMRMDLYHQYGPLFAELYDRICEHKSMLYSWTTGGGSSFIGNYFNYLSSPFSVLIFLFDKKDISFAITLIVAVKCILSAGTFSYYLKSSQRGNNFLISVFGVFYAFCSYFLAYYWNVMWLDGMLLFPIIILGIERLVKSGKCLTYIISLAVLLYSSYYMGYMTCIFSVIYFLFSFLILNKGGLIDKKRKFEKAYSFKALMNKTFFNRCVLFALSSVVAGALCALSLVPVFMILKNSSATSDSFPTTFESYFNIFDFLTSHLATLETTIRSSGEDVLPNVYSGIPALILVPLYVVNKDIRLKEKTGYILILLLLLFSFDNNMLNFVWHAMHFPNDLPFRFSYMYSFILLIIAYRSAVKLRSLEIKDIGYVGMAWVFFIIIAQKMATTKMSELTIYMSIAFIILWTAFLYIYRRGKLERTLTAVLAVTFVFVEVVICDTLGMPCRQKNSDYVANFDAITAAVEEIEANDKGFYRTEQSYLTFRMDPAYYGYDGISNFSSMAYESYSGLQYNLGMMSNKINSYTYNPQTPVYNMFHNIKYIIYNGTGTEPTENLFNKIDTLNNGNTVIYEYKYALPTIYSASVNLDEWQIDEGYPFTVQEQYFDLATGLTDVFKPVTYTDTQFDGMSGEKLTENGTCWYYKEETESNYGYVHITMTPEINGNVYLYVNSKSAESYEVIADNGFTSNMESDEPYILDLGYYEAGDVIKLNLDCSAMDTNEGYAEVYAYTCDEAVLAQGYNRLLRNAMNITSHSDTEITGTISVSEDSYLCSSIPFDKSWSIYIDGQKAETFELGEALLTTTVKHGEHTVTYKYNPQGLNAGAAVSAITLAGLCSYVIIHKRKQKRNAFKTLN